MHSAKTKCDMCIRFKISHERIQHCTEKFVTKDTFLVLQIQFQNSIFPVNPIVFLAILIILIIRETNKEPIFFLGSE